MPHIELKDAVNGQFYWRFVADNGEVVCNSETYTAKQSALYSANLVKRTASVAPIYDRTRSAALSYRR